MSNFSPFKGRDGTSWHLALVHCMPRGRFEVPSLTWSHPTLVPPLICQCGSTHPPINTMIHTVLLLMTITIFVFTVTFLYIKVRPWLPNESSSQNSSCQSFGAQRAPRLLISCNTLHKELPTRLLLCNSQTIVSYFHTSILSYMKHMIPCTKDYLPDCSPATASKFEIRRDNWVSLFPSQLFCPMIGLTLKTL